MIAHIYDISIGNVKKLVPNFFMKKVCSSLWKLATLFETGIKNQKVRRLSALNQSQWLKPYNKFNAQKRTEAEKNGDKDGKVLYKLMKNAVYGKTMENLRNRINVRLVSNKKEYLKWTSKPSYMSQKIFDNNLVAILKSKVTLTLQKPVYIGGVYIISE